jgi:uncharacterized protein
MKVFVDTSAFLALLDGDEDRHAEAVAAWERLTEKEAVLFTSNYVVLETNALVQRRLGQEALRIFLTELLGGVTVVFVERDVHDAATAAQLLAGRRRLGLVDCTSFQLMHALGLADAFAFDDHFRERGFGLV